MPFKEAKDAIIDQFERRYLAALLEWSNGNVSRAAPQSRARPDVASTASSSARACARRRPRLSRARGHIAGEPEATTPAIEKGAAVLHMSPVARRNGAILSVCATSQNL